MLVVFCTLIITGFSRQTASATASSICEWYHSLALHAMSEIQNGEPTSLQRDQTTHDFVTGLKEREELKAKLQEKEREVNTLKGQNYDLFKKIESLEKQIAELSEQKPKGKERRKTIAEKEKPKPKRPAPRKKDKKSKDIAPAKEIENNTLNHDDPFQDPEKLYASIAERYPDMPLSQVLQAEKKFVEADINRDGTIDVDEMEKMLDSNSGLMFTKAELKDIFKRIDIDNTNSLDFMEVLSILDLIRSNRNVGMQLSPAAKQNVKSQVCSIQ